MRSNFCQLLYAHFQKGQTFIIVCQSGEISSILVTMFRSFNFSKTGFRLKSVARDVKPIDLKSVSRFNEFSTVCWNLFTGTFLFIELATDRMIIARYKLMYRQFWAGPFGQNSTLELKVGLGYFESLKIGQLPIRRI